MQVNRTVATDEEMVHTHTHTHTHTHRYTQLLRERTVVMDPTSHVLLDARLQEPFEFDSASDSDRRLDTLDDVTAHSTSEFTHRAQGTLDCGPSAVIRTESGSSNSKSHLAGALAKWLVNVASNDAGGECLRVGGLVGEWVFVDTFAHNPHPHTYIHPPTDPHTNTGLVPLLVSVRELVAFQVRVVRRVDKIVSQGVSHVHRYRTTCGIKCLGNIQTFYLYYVV